MHIFIACVSETGAPWRSLLPALHVGLRVYQSTKGRAKSHMVRLKTPDFPAYEFDKDLPSLQQIAHAAKQSGGYLKRLVWWETCHSSTLCWRLLAKPLFSLRSVGSQSQTGAWRSH